MQELRQNEIIDRLKAFSLTPDPGTVVEVSAGEGRPLVIAYSADSLSYGGVHDLPVLVILQPRASSTSPVCLLATVLVVSTTEGR